MHKIMMMATLATGLFLAGCSRQSNPAASQNLSGAWTLTLPAGFEHAVTLTRLGKARYQLTKPGLNMEGVYEVRGDRLVIVAPRNPRFAGFVWHIDDASRLTMVEQPAVEQTGGNYLGATLTRAN